MPETHGTENTPESRPNPPQSQMSENEESWARQMYKLMGETFPSMAAAFDELIVAERQREREEVAQATARMDQEDHLEAEKEARRTAAIAMALDDVERSAELQLEMNSLRSDPQDGIEVPDAPDLTLDRVINGQITALKQQKEKLFADIRVFKGLDAEKDAFTSAYEVAGLLLEKAFIQRGVYNFEACEVTLQEAERKLDDMKSLLRDAQVHPSTFVSSQDEALIAMDVAAVKETTFELEGVGYSGLASRVLVQMNKYQDRVTRPDDPRWKELMSDARACKAALPELRSSTKFIETLCESMTTAGPTTAASETLAELHNYQTDPSRNLPTILRFITALKGAASRREKWIKNEEWAKTNMDVRTRLFRERLEKFIVFDDDDHVVTKESKSEAYARAVDTEGLDKDVMAQVAKRPKGKKVKAVPRSTINSLLESLEFLDELRLSGVTGIESIALEEFIKTEDILEGINSNPTGFDDLQKRTQKMLEKVASTKTGKEAIYYIEAKMNLEEDIRILLQRAPEMNINKALAECGKLEATRFEPLLKQLRSAIDFREVFDKKLDPIEKTFKEIPGLLAKLGAARPELAKKFKRIWQPKKEKIYHGELELELKQAKVTAHNSATVDDIKEAITQVNRVRVQADRYVQELQNRISRLEEDVDAPFSDPEQEFFQKIEDDYKQGVQLEKDRKVAKGKFSETAGPMKDELEMLTAKSKSWKGAKALMKGLPRIDEAAFDPTRFKDLLAEVKLLEQECAVNSSYEENMDRLNELKGMYDAMRGELTGFREDIAKDIVKATEKCIARMEAAKSFAENEFVTGVEGKQETGEEYVNSSTLKRFTTCVSKPIVAGELRQHAQIIGDKRKSLAERKKAREDAIRIVRPLLARLDSDKAIKLYRRHPFTDLDNDINILRPVLVQLEVKLLTLAS